MDEFVIDPDYMIGPKIPKSAAIEKIRHNFEEMEKYISHSSTLNKSYVLQYLLEYDKSNICKLLLEKLEDSEIQFVGKELLKIAISKNRQDVLQYLLSSGLDINNALKIACAYGKINIVKYLIDNGADVHTDNDYPICVACTNSLDMVKLLHDNGANIYVRNELPLRLATESGIYGIVQYLVNNNANVNARDGHALRLAVKIGSLSIIELLINSGADINFLKTKYLIQVLQARWYDVVKLLAKYGVKFDIFNNYDFDKRDKELVTLLFDQGVNPDVVACMMMYC